VPAELEHLAVGQGARRALGDVVHRHHGGDAAAHRLGLRRGGEEIVERAALVGLEVREGDVAQALERPAPAALKRQGVFTTQMRLVAVEDAGERLLGEYTFMHTPS
jgi:hypothetical protein